MSIRPLFSVDRGPTRGFADALPALPREAAISPWTPRVIDAPAPPAPPPPPPDFRAEREAAQADGYAEGLRETDELRMRLTALATALDAAGRDAAAPIKDLATEIAITVVEAWAAHADHSAALKTAIAEWIGAAPAEAATVRVHPSELDAVTTAAGDAPLTIKPDATLARGELAIASPTRELQRSLASRLGDLRTAIAEAFAKGAE